VTLCARNTHHFVIGNALGTYYSYLYAKLYAAHIWHTHFAADPLNRYVVFRCVCLLWALAVGGL
jgi:Zn-dependent oligopeptidase